MAIQNISETMVSGPCIDGGATVTVNFDVDTKRYSKKLSRGVSPELQVFTAL